MQVLNKQFYANFNHSLPPLTSIQVPWHVDLSHDLSWSKTHRRNVQKCLQAGCLWPLVTRMFKTTLHPTCEIKTGIYAAPVWDPHQKTNSHKIEKVQKFALKICTKLWNRDYDSLLDTVDLPSLSTRRLYLKLSYLYQVINGITLNSLIHHWKEE